MAHQWKAGDRAMVEIVATEGNGVRIRCRDGEIVWLHNNALHPLPAPDPHQALRDAVVEAFDDAVGNPNYGVRDCYKMSVAVEKLLALRAALTPPDPWVELQSAHDALMTAFAKCKDAEYRAWSTESRAPEKAHTAAIEVLAKAETRWNAALEAARKVKP